MVVPFFKNTLAGQGIVTVTAVLVSLSSGTLYAWAAYSPDLRDHFGWSLQEAMTVNTAGIFGDSLLSVLVGCLINSYGPVVAMGYSTALLSGSFFALYLFAVEQWSNVMLASILYMCNGKGSVGSYMVALFSISTTWPAHMAGTGVAVLDVGFSMSSVLVASVYPLLGSVKSFYLTMAAITLVVGGSLLLIHVDWNLLSWALASRGDSEPLRQCDNAELEEVDEKHMMSRASSSTPIMQFNSMTTRSDDVLPPRLSMSEGRARHQTLRASLQERPSFQEEMIIAHRFNDNDVALIFGFAPTADELRATYQHISVFEAVLKLEFCVCATFCFFCFTTTSILSAQLVTVRRQMDVDLDIATLLTTVMVCAAIGKLVGGAMSDYTAQTVFCGRQFYIFLANVVIFASFWLLAFAAPSENLLVGVLIALGVARGSGSVIFTTLLKESFGARMLGVFIGLTYVFFFFGYAGWSYVFVMCRDGRIPVNFWKLVLLGTSVPMVVSGFAWRRQVQGRRASR